MLVDILLDMDQNKKGSDGLTDEELCALAKTDRTAMNSLMQRYAKLVMIKSEILADPASDCDDLRSEGLIALMKAISSYDPSRGAKFATFAEICVVNRMKSCKVRLKRNADKHESFDEEAAGELSAEETPESIYLSKEFFSELWSSICSVLSASELRVFDLCVGGMSYKAVAQKLGITEKSVDNAMQRSRRKIKKLLREQKLNM